MTKETQIKRNILAMGLCDAIGALYATSIPPNSAVAAVVDGYMLAYQKLGDEQVAPTKPKQRRARRKKLDMAAINEKLDSVAKAGIA